MCVEELLELVDSEVFVDIEISVGEFHIALGVVGVVGDGHFVACCGVAEVFGSGKHVAFEHVDGGIGVLGVFSGFLESFGDVAVVLHWIGIVICAGDGHAHFGIFLAEFLSLLELFLGSFVVTFLKRESTETYIVEGAFCIRSESGIEISAGLGFVALNESNLSEVVVGQGAVGRGIVDSSFENCAGIVVLSGFVVFDTVFVALCLGTYSESAGNEQRQQKFDFHSD